MFLNLTHVKKPSLPSLIKGRRGKGYARFKVIFPNKLENNAPVYSRTHCVTSKKLKIKPIFTKFFFSYSSLKSLIAFSEISYNFLFISEVLEMDLGTNRFALMPLSFQRVLTICTAFSAQEIFSIIF